MSKSSNPVIVGLDEAGRGPLAGPVVAGTCLLTNKVEKSPLINDSKQLTEFEREEAYLWIEENCTYGFGVVEASEVDSLGILGATEKAMQIAVELIAESVTPTYLIIDGRDRFWFDYPHSSVIRGDEKEPCISAASIIAKVIRDRIMIEYSKKFPKYSFEDHKGYGAPVHLDALKIHGPCAIHRKTFLTKILPEEILISSRLSPK